MLTNYMGIINLDENEDDMMELTVQRPLASIPIAGRYRIIDFILSNMTNAGIENIAIFAKNNSRSLVDHISNGRPWDLNRKRFGLRFFNFGKEDPEHNDVNNFAENLDYFKIASQEYVIMAPSYMIYNIDFSEVAEAHENSGNDITMIYKRINNADKAFKGCEALNINEEGRVLSVGKNFGEEKEINIGMEAYVMKRELFMEMVIFCTRTGCCRKFKDCIYTQLNKYKVGTYKFNGYLSCLNSLYAYYNTSMDFLNVKVNTELFSQTRPIMTKSKDEAPTRYTKNGRVINSMVANGCIIEGDVENCIIFRRVVIKKGAKLKNCIIFQASEIEENANLNHVITDKGIIIEADKQLKGDDEYPLAILRKKSF
ncbi:glucose-1-phosphate adenylyltransferase subunit GlgD [Clostridium polynesiense]|uniref:glucose-1-phosphate adenylyltransferase subunit GlgD n=1 Tax=Clostridium polynesiense TaxID=1325933 RepID=UPI00058B104C|nr:glucose-1-phosphate adenylyltransferase subunit GlgD [Clostridium polynesiense]